MAQANNIIYVGEDTLLDFDMSGALSGNDAGHTITAVNSIQAYLVTNGVASATPGGLVFANQAHNSAKLVQANTTAATVSSLGDTYKIVVEVDTNRESSRIGIFYVAVLPR